MSNVLVLAGGNSSEREVSLRSGAAVADALRMNGHMVNVIDPADGLEDLLSADVVFPALHGQGGEDGTIQAELEARHLPFVGSDSKTSALCFNKPSVKQLLTREGITMPRGETVTLRTIWQSPFVSQPFAIKPIDGGSSIDTFIVRDVNAYDKAAIEDALTRHSHMLIEELIPGTELTVAVLGSEALPVIEIIPPENGEFDYENKYNGKSQELCPPRHISESAQQDARALALLAHTRAGCRDLSRIDMMLTPDGTLVVLEINTLPGMTPASLFPKAAAAAGLDMPDLCERLIQMALARAR